MANLITNLVFNISDCTDANDHTGALIHLANAIEDVAMVDALNVIDREHERAGYLSEVMASLRNTVREQLFKNAEDKIDAKDFKLIKSMF